jgi:hypothetical protein
MPEGRTLVRSYLRPGLVYNLHGFPGSKLAVGSIVGPFTGSCPINLRSATF